MIEKKHFHGFKPQTLKFLRNLERNNKKEWFEEHRKDYETLLLNPFKQLATDLGESMLLIDPMLEIKPVVNKTTSRIHRDTRFSKDKSPYKSNLWLTFKRQVPDWKTTPVFFFELFKDWYRFGMGFYSASPATMGSIRKLIDENPDDFAALIRSIDQQQHFKLDGDDYKRTIPNNHPEEFQPWYRKRNFFLPCNCETDDLLMSPELSDRILEGFNLLVPLYRFLWKAIE